MAEFCQTRQQTTTTNSRWSRSEVVDAIFQFHNAEGDIDIDISQRDFAGRAGIPRSTFQQWLARTEETDAPDQLVFFFESPQGLELLHRIVVAAIVVITQMAPGGIRLVGTFLRLSGLDRFAACSYGVLHRAVSNLETELGDFGQSEQERLGKLMRPRDITLCEDETFPPPALPGRHRAGLAIHL